MTYTSTSSSLAHVVSDSLKNIQVTHSKVAMSYNAVSITVFFPLNLVRKRSRRRLDVPRYSAYIHLFA